MKDYPHGSQANKDNKDIVVPVKLFDQISTVKWWLAEYDPESEIAFGYITGYIKDRWEIISLEKLEDLWMEIKTAGKI